MKTYVIEDKFNVDGVECIIIFGRSGYRCAYVGVPETSKFYCEHYDTLRTKCRYELTWGNFINGNGFNPELYYIGFDCGHYNQGADMYALDHYFDDLTNEEYLDANSRNGKEVSLDECKTAISSLARYIAYEDSKK